MTKKMMEMIGGWLIWINPTSMENMTHGLNDDTVNHFVENKNEPFSEKELTDIGLVFRFEYNNINDPSEDPIGRYLVFELRKIRYVFRIVRADSLYLYVISQLD